MFLFICEKSEIFGCDSRTKGRGRNRKSHIRRDIDGSDPDFKAVFCSNFQFKIFYWVKFSNIIPTSTSSSALTMVHQNLPPSIDGNHFWRWRVRAVAARLTEQTTMTRRAFRGLLFQVQMMRLHRIWQFCECMSPDQDDEEGKVDEPASQQFCLPENDD